MIKKEHNYSIQFLRFLFTMLICYGHLLTVTSLAGFQEYSKYTHYINGCWIAVPFFFIMSGFFLSHSIKKNVEIFVQDRIIRLWPVMAFSIFLFAIFKYFDIFGVGLNSKDFATLLFLQGTGISQTANINGVVWYVCVLFWTSLIYLIYLKIVKRKWLQILSISLIVFVTGYLYVKYMFLPIRDIVFNFVSIMMLDGFSFVGFGILLHYFNEFLNKCLEHKLHFKAAPLILKCIYSFLEIAIFGIICVFTMYNSEIMPYPLNPVLISILFGILFILFVNKSGVLSSFIFNCKYLDFLGNASYSIYVMQITTFAVIYSLSCSHQEFLKTHVMLTIILAMILYNLTGYITYFLIEKPTIDLYKKIKGNKNE